MSTWLANWFGSDSVSESETAMSSSVEKESVERREKGDGKKEEEKNNYETDLCGRAIRECHRNNIGRKFFIVALDGGGVRGALQCELLARLFKKFPTLEQRVDMYAGSSVGAFLAAGCATLGFAEAHSRCSEEQFARIFQRTWRRETTSIGGWYEALYNGSSVRDFCHDYFDERTFDDAQKHLLVTAFRVDATSKEEAKLDLQCAAMFPPDRWQPVIYHNLDIDNPTQLQTSISESLLQSSAAPGYFPVHKKCIDGGLLANNPSMLAVAYANRFNLVDSLDQIVVLSLGTGKAPQNMTEYGADADIGKAQWLPRVADLLMQSNAECATLECAALLGEQRFCRVQPLLGKSIAIDDYTKVPLLKQLATQVDLSEAEQLIQRLLCINK